MAATASVNVSKDGATGRAPTSAIVTVPAQSVPGDSNYDLVATLDVSNVGTLSITGIVGGTGPLTGLQLTGAVKAGGTHVTLLTDNDFGAGAGLVLRSFGMTNNSGGFTAVPSGSSFIITLPLIAALSEVRLYGKSANGCSLAMEILARPAA